MELKEFVKSTLLDIAAGVRAANIEIASVHSVQGAYLLKASGALDERAVMFDVAVTSSASDSTSGGLGLRIAGVGVGVDGKGSESNENVSRIRFCVVRNEVLS